MKRLSFISITLFALFLLVGTNGFAAAQKFPKINGKETLATVNGEPITLEEFSQELVSLHTGMVEGKTAAKINEPELLNRLINIRLILQEARNIGLDDLPEVKEMVDAFSRATLREQLIERQLKGVKADEKETEEIYKDSIREWKINSVMLEKEEDAKKMEEEIKAGHPFEEVARKFIASGTAKGGEEKDYLGRKELLPQIAATLSNMKVGSISPIIRVGTGFVILTLQDIRYTENPEAREQAKQEALRRRREIALKDYKDALIKKYVKVHKEVFDPLDFESKEPGFEKLLKDPRVVAEIKGEKPITVGELTEQLRQQFFHGIQQAIESKRVNEKKLSILDEILYERVFRKEAFRLGIDKTAAYRNQVKEYKDSIIFGAFVQKAVAPDIKISEDELRAYYKDHIAEYTSPEMMKIDSLAFLKRSDAEDCIEKLRKGTDPRWLMANAEGQVDKDTKDLLNFENRLLATKGLPEGVRKVVSGARPGDLRLYASPEGPFYVLMIKEVVPPKPQPYETARQSISKIIFNDKLKKAVEDYADKLRALSNVKIYLK